jgi:hypothetical protein
LAFSSIEHGLKTGKPLEVHLKDFPKTFHSNRACFVTLELQNNLRGCIGSLEPRKPLIFDVAKNAFNAAFQDPRFSPLSEKEFPDLSVKISVLSLPEAISFRDEKDLLSKIRPHIDGLILEEKGRNGFFRGTFLPSVWESLPEPREFLKHLKQKANLPGDYWSDTLSIERYTTEAIP